MASENVLDAAMIQQAYEELKKENDALKKTVDAQSSKLGGMWQENDVLRNDLNDEFNKWQASEAKYEELAEKQVWLQKQYVDERNKNYHLPGVILENDNMKEEIAVLHKRINMLVSKNEDFKDLNETLYSHVNRLERSDKQWKKRNKELEEQIHELKGADYIKIKKEIVDLMEIKEEHKTLENENKRMRKHIHKIEKELRKVRGPLTRPWCESTASLSEPEKIV